MRHIVEAGTDVATLLLFDPAALPRDFDARFPDDPQGVIQRLADEGCLASISTGADGSYLLHAFAGESVPGSLEPHIADPLVTSDFRVPSGRVFFTGSEYGSPHVEQALAAHSHMGGSFTIAPGTYELTLWRVEYADDHQDRIFAAEVSAFEYRAYQSIGWLIVAAAVGGLVVLALGIAAAWSPLLGFALAVEVLLIALPILVTRLPSYRRANERWNDIGRRYPSIVARLVNKAVA